MKKDKLTYYDYKMEYIGIKFYIDTEYQPEQKGDLETEHLYESWDINNVYVTNPLNSEVIINDDNKELTDNLVSVYHLLLPTKDTNDWKQNETINLFSKEDQEELLDLSGEMPNFDAALENDIREYYEEQKADFYIDQYEWNKYN